MTGAEDKGPAPLRRVWAYARGDQSTAEALHLDEITEVAWINAQPDGGAGEAYALEATIKSAEAASRDVEGLRDRAGSLVNLNIALAPFLAAGLAVTAAGSRWPSVGTFVASLVCLVYSAILAFLASGTIAAVRLNVDFLNPAADGSTDGMRKQEAQVWHEAAMAAMQVGQDHARLIFQARRFVVFTLILGAVAIALFPLRMGSAAQCLDPPCIPECPTSPAAKQPWRPPSPTAAPPATPAGDRV